jgi:hypothetical protein
LLNSLLFIGYAEGSSWLLREHDAAMDQQSFTQNSLMFGLKKHNTTDPLLLKNYNF